MQRRFEPAPSSVPVESDCVVETEGVGEDTLLHPSGHEGQSKSSRINTTPHTIIDGPGMKFNKHNLRRRRDIGIEQEKLSRPLHLVLTPIEKSRQNLRTASAAQHSKESAMMEMTPEKRKTEAPSQSPLKSFL